MTYNAKNLTDSQRDAANIIIDAANAAGLNPNFMLALAVTESSLRPTITGDDGISIGLFQLKLSTARDFDPTVTGDDLLTASVNARIAMQDMAALMIKYPGRSYGGYAEAWTLGGTGRFVRGHRNPLKIQHMQDAIAALGLTLHLNEVAA